MNQPSQHTNCDGAGISDVQHQAIRNCVARICETKGFSKSERLKRFLSFMVERLLAGDLDNFKEYSIALAVFDRSPEYNPKIDAVVRVEARRLRSRLDQYYATEGLHDSIRINFPSGSYMPVIVCSQEQSVSGKPRFPGSRKIFVRWCVAAAFVAVIAIALATGRMSVHRSPSTEVVRLVRDSAASFDPVISRDGKMLAYASDQSGNVDIWLRPLNGGEPRRLTSDPAADTLPISR